MITVHGTKDDPETERLIHQLEDLVLSFKTEFHEEANGLPYIEENGKEIRGAKALEEWVQQLESELNWQRSLSGDGCYIDPESGKVC